MQLRKVSLIQGTDLSFDMHCFFILIRKMNIYLYVISGEVRRDPKTGLNRVLISILEKNLLCYRIFNAKRCSANSYTQTLLGPKGMIWIMKELAFTNWAPPNFRNFRIFMGGGCTRLWKILNKKKISFELGPPQTFAESTPLLTFHRTSEFPPYYRRSIVILTFNRNSDVQP